MKLLWKLLRRHVSIPQFCGFILANLIGMIIILTGFQFYNDVLPVFTSEDSFMKTNYLMVTKRIGMGNTLSGRSANFTSRDTVELCSQSFTNKVGAFTPANYKTDARMGIEGKQIINSELFFESVPDEFVDIPKKIWTYTPGSYEVPVIVPRTYINMYNFGFARNHSLPQISEGMMGMIDFEIYARGNGHEKMFKGRVVAFSNSISSILVPQSFMDWSNNEFAPNDEVNPTRLLIEVTNPADERITQYMEQHGLEMESDKLNAEKMTYFLRIMVGIVVVVGILICALSIFILVLSIYLLVEKNTEKLHNLLLIGYTAGQAAMPYQMLTVTINAAIMIVTLITVFLLRNCYVFVIQSLYPNAAQGTVWPTVVLGIILFLIISAFNLLIIRCKINKL